MSSIVGLLGQALPRESIDETKFTKNVLLDPNFRPEGAFVVEDDLGKAVGMVLAISRQVPIEGAMPNPERGYITLLAVGEEAQMKGVGSKLLDAAEIYLITQNKKEVWISPYSPNYFAPGVDVAAYAQGLAFLLNRGFEEVSRPLSMEVDLAAVKEPDWVDKKRSAAEAEGVRFTAWKPELTLPLLTFAREEFGPDWARYVRSAAEAILDGDPPERLVIAQERGRILGFSHFERDRFGPIGVASSERGRGLGQVLMFETLKAQKGEGYMRSYFLWSDDKTAEKLYDAAGFKEARRFAVLRKEL